MDLRKIPSDPNRQKDIKIGTKTGTSAEALFFLNPLIFNPGMGTKVGISENAFFLLGPLTLNLAILTFNHRE